MQNLKVDICLHLEKGLVGIGGGGGGTPYTGLVGIGGGGHEGRTGGGGGGGGDLYTGSLGGDGGGGGVPYNGTRPGGAGWQGYSQRIGKASPPETTGDPMKIELKRRKKSKVKKEKYDHNIAPDDQILGEK
ncbi:glycine-rich protein DOT1-like [Cynara cardunculus var. scolymus]|uniref:glycine-rich protein DOT1-like n=1 Tax=Cynara cardunculus var. scolymus TaxID=59895 RepID=UPI000D62B9E7|nr:glycine-rich protein DOT1-like [Cynara cardunculus var. scolymus]